MVELLAPAGSIESLVAAVENGANAVYLAGNMFGARAYASNFDEDGLREAVKFAHQRNVRVHVTVNTVVDDEEFPALAEYLRFLYNIGVDAVLVQDLGVAKLAKKVAPKLPLHASTQMTVHNLAGVLALEELGFERVVLSREVTLKDIEYICANCQVEIETFVHGALCVCYSGQCLMSSMIGGRSGNRGRCAQPCRLNYKLVDENNQDLLQDKAGQYLLSPRDLKTIDLLPQLIKAGVSSLKIEGRMKKPEYVAVVVRTYREAIDAVLQEKAEFVTAEMQQHLKQIFNRDFTTAYLLDRPGKNMMSDRRPNNRGLLLGRVVRYDKNRQLVFVKLQEKLSLGDQVDFWVKVGGRVTATLQQMQVKGKSVSEALPGEEVAFPLDSFVREHDRVFKVFDAPLTEKARQSFKSGAPVRRFPITAVVCAAVGKPLTITLKDEEGHEVSAATEFIGEQAMKRPLTSESISKQMSRLGSTVYELKELQTELEGDVMVPVSEINEARRKATELLDEVRMSVYAREEESRHEWHWPGGRKKSHQLQLVVAVDTLEKARAALANGADGIVFGGDSYQHELLQAADYQAALELAAKNKAWAAFNTPRIVNERNMGFFVKLLESFRTLKPAAVYVHNIGTLALVKKILPDVPVRSDYSLLTYNSLTTAALQDLGVSSAVLSPELTFTQVKEIAGKSSLPLEAVVHGNLELMVSEYCTAGSFLGELDKGACRQPCMKMKKQFFLEDRKGIKFPLRFDQFCHMHVLNSKCLSMLPYVQDFRKIGIECIRLEAKAMTKEKVAATVREYAQALRLNPGGEDLQEMLKEREEGEITRGHYFRGVM